MTPKTRKKLYREVFEHGPDGIVGVFGSGGIAIVNREACSMFGYSEEELLSLGIEDLIPESFRESHKQYRGHYSRYPHTRRMGTYLELSGRRKDGTVFPVDVMLCPLSVGSDLMVVSIIRDMTTRLKEMREREQLRRNLNEALTKVEALHGLLPICAWCKKIRDDHGYWSRLEEYFHEHSQLDFTHGICPDCAAAFANRKGRLGRPSAAPIRQDQVIDGYVSGGSRLISVRFG